MFLRSKHRIILTEDGMLLRRRAEEIVSLAEKTKEDFLRKQEQIAGTIAIGSGELQSSAFLTRLITAFQKEHPLVYFTIYSGHSENIKERLERGLLTSDFSRNRWISQNTASSALLSGNSGALSCGRIRSWRKRKAFPPAIWPACLWFS